MCDNVLHSIFVEKGDFQRIKKYGLIWIMEVLSAVILPVLMSKKR